MPTVAVTRARCSPVFALVALLAAVGCREDAESPMAPQESPTLAAATALSFVQVSGGAFHSCGVTTNGQAYCWGGNTYGQLGNGTRTHTVAPVAVQGGLRFRHVNVGYDHTCGLTTDNLVYCWGLNMWGQIGDGTKGSDNWRTTPTLVVGGRRYRQVRAGWSHTCAISMSDVAWCWGFNGNGQLGDGATTAEGRARPVRVLGSQVWKQLSGGAEHTCGVTTGDQAYCWGLNDNGQLGIGNTTRRLQPAPVSGGRQFRQTDAGGFHTCAVTMENLAYCWGFNWQGALGDGTTADRLTPGAVAGLRRFDHVNAGGYHTCGVTMTGKGFCWGANGDGRIGDGTPESRVRPAQLSGDLQLRQIGAGLNHTCAVTTANLAYCWGANGGRVGDGTTGNRLFPTPVAGPS